MNSRINVGRPDSSSALWRACSLEVLKSLHTGHSPVTSAWAPAGSAKDETRSMTSPADSGRWASLVAASSTGTSAVRPSCEISPALAGMASGSATACTPSAPVRPLTIAVTAAGSVEMGVSWWMTTTAASAPTCGKSVRSSSRTRWAIEPCASQPAPESAPLTEIASGAAANAAINHSSITGLRRRAEKRPSRANQCSFVEVSSAVEVSTDSTSLSTMVGLDMMELLSFLWGRASADRRVGWRRMGAVSKRLNSTVVRRAS